MAEQSNGKREEAARKERESKNRIRRIGWPVDERKSVLGGKRIRIPGPDFGRAGTMLSSRMAIVGFAALFTVVMVLSALAAWRGGTGFDVIRRRIRYGSAEESGGVSVYSYAYSAKSRFAALGDTLVVLSDSELSVLNAEGETADSRAVRMSHPALSTGGGRAAAWDVGGTELYLLDENGVLDTMTTDAEEPYVSARLNENGFLAVTTAARGGMGAVRVYDDERNELFEFDTSGRLVADAIVTNDNLRLAAAVLGRSADEVSVTDNGTGGPETFASEIVFYRLNSTEMESSRMLEDALPVALSQRGSELVVVCDTRVVWMRPDGAPLSEWSYGGERLREYDLGGKDGVTLLLSGGTAGEDRLVSVERGSGPIGTLPITQEVLSLSAAGRYVAVLYANRLAVYNERMQEYASLSGTGHLREILARPDGSVLLLGALSGGLFLP